jgi:lipopolysaccharide transport system permease protein
VWRDVKVRYQQTILGVLWVVLQPLLYALLFSLVFGGVIGVSSNGVPYLLFCFTGLIAWNLFSIGIAAAAASVVSHSELVQKVYFPRLLMPLSAILVGLVDFAVNVVALCVLMAYYGWAPSANILLAPLFVISAILAAVGIGSALAALNVRFRDVRHITPVLTQLWLIATPVAYPITLVPDRWTMAFGLNPMTGIVEGFRWAILGTPMPSPPLLGVSTAAMAIALLAGLMIFRRMEPRFADVI